MRIEKAYRDAWNFKPPLSCREMHAAGLFRGPKALQLRGAEIYDAETISEGDSFVAETLIPKLIPIGGDKSGDRWCFDARRKLDGRTAVLHCPHDGGGATFVAPSFAAFIYLLVADNRTKENIERVRPWMLKRWLRALASEGDIDVTEDPAFVNLPEDEFDHFR